MFSLALLALVISTIAQGVVSVPLSKRADDPKVIVVLKGDVSIAKVAVDDSSSNVQKLNVINGFIAPESEVDLEKLRADPNVLSVERDEMVEITRNGPQHGHVTRENAPWGLARLSSDGVLANQDPYALDFEYSYRRPAGNGVDVYVVDTGVRVTHEQFDGRARWGATFGGYADADGNGHGTHCAGTIAGSQFGVANRANIIAVKVLSDSGSGSYSGVISGLEWVYNEVLSTSRPSVVSMSLRGGGYAAMDAAVAKLVETNIHVVVAAGNDYSDASNYSPARAPDAITVGATDISDARAAFSNFGEVVDVHAPGVAVTSAWSTSDTATNSISGTSMATPHVAGLVAYIISIKGNMDPVAMSDLIKKWGVDNVLSNIPDGTTNVLAHNSRH